MLAGWTGAWCVFFIRGGCWGLGGGGKWCRGGGGWGTGWVGLVGVCVWGGV
jgi:hypothetical protein